MESDRASQPNVLHLLHWKTGSLAALLGVLAALPAAGQLVQDPPPELSFLSTILKVRKNIPYEAWAEVKFPPNRDVGPAKQGKHWFILPKRERRDMVAEWKQDQAGVPAERLDRRQRISDGRIAGGAALRQEPRRGLGEHGTTTFQIFRLDVIEVAPLPLL